MPGAALGAQSSLARAQRAACHVRPCTRTEEPPALMHGLTERQVLLSLVALALVLLTARAFGELARRLRQPEVLGELFGGVVLGPSVVGALAPGFHRVLFQDPAVGVVLSGISWIGALVLLLMAGIEVDVSILRKEARPGALSALGAIAPPLRTPGPLVQRMQGTLTWDLDVSPRRSAQA
uniref:Cation/H+ exchanger transmembrane domain-containing protein n=1 Tax=Sorangium cellulosum TaxID=56 RepID=D2X900_SORCE|nr:hypothetical protein [Sorangium cellulosum]